MAKKNKEKKNKKKKDDKTYTFKWDKENTVVSSPDNLLPVDPLFEKLEEAELLAMNSSDLEAYIKEFRKNMQVEKISDFKKRESSLMKIRRRVRNREHAHTSRMRKGEIFKGMEFELERLKRILTDNNIEY